MEKAIQKAYEHLKALLIEGDSASYEWLESGRFTEWQRSVQTALRCLHGDRDDYITRFFKTYFSPRTFSARTPDSVFRCAFLSGMTEAKAIVRSAIEEFEDRSKLRDPSILYPCGPPPPIEIRSAFEDSPLPTDLGNYISELEEWAKGNKRDAYYDALAFWSLKVPAMLSAASAGVWAHFELTTVSVIAGAIASLCVIIDGVHPRGMLRNIHLRAYHDLRNLTTKMVSAWRTRNRNAKEDTVVTKIIKDSETERDRIAAYIRDAETALNYKAHHEPDR
jgi:hypothetical protein